MSKAIERLEALIGRHEAGADFETMNAAVLALPALLRVAKAARVWCEADDGTDAESAALDEMLGALEALDEVSP